MPTAPRYDQLRVAPRPLNNPGLQRPAATPASEGVERFEAIARFGETAARLGTQLVGDVIQNERDRADTVAITAAERQLGDLESLLLHNPDSGALTTVKGKDAAGLRQKVGIAFEEQAGMIAGNLTTDRQRLAFERMKADRWRAMSLAVDQHTVRELDAYEVGEAKAALDTSVSAAIENYDNPLRVRAELDRQAIIIERHGYALGLKGEAQQQAFLVDLATKTHEGVLTRMLAAGQDLRAQAYFDKAKQAGEIAGDALPRLEERLSNGSSAIAGLRAANEIWDAHAPKDDDDPIELDKMEAEARTRFATDPKTLQQTIAQLRERKQGVDSGRKERDDARLSAVWGLALKGQSYAAIARTEEFLTAPARVQVQLRDYFQRQAEHQANLAYQAEARANAREQREYTRQQRAERQLELNGWSRYFELSDPRRLAAMSRADILKELPTLGREHVNRLLTDQEQLQRSEAAVRAVTMDSDVFKEVAYSAGLDYAYDTPGRLSDTQKANLGKLEAAVKDEIGRQQVEKKRQLTLEEKRAITQQLVDQKVMVKDSGWFFFDGDPQIATTVSERDKPSAYVPLEKIPPAVLQQAIGELRKVAPGVPDAELQRRYQDRIERAYGARLVGRSRSDIEAILKGAQ